MTRPDMLSPEGMKRLLAEMRVESADIPVAPSDEPWPVTVSLEDALNSTRRDSACRHCEAPNCLGCPGAEPVI